jgi:hypothetical protein
VKESEKVKEELIRRQTVEQLVAAYVRSEARIRQGCKLIAESERELTEAFSIGDLRGIDFREEDHRSRLNYDDPKDGIAYLRKQIWRVLVDRLEIRRMMSIAKAKELATWLDKESGGEDVTVESVLGFFRYYVQNLETMLEEAVVEVYDALRPRYDRYKTNSQYLVGKRVILSGWVSKWFRGDRTRVNHHYRDHYVALENVFTSLDGRGSITKHHLTELERKIDAGELSGETTYFKYRACAKGTLHLEFKRPDLVRRFNEIAGRRLLGKGGEEGADDAAA